MDTATAVNKFLLSRQAKGLAGETIRWYKGILLFFINHYSNIPNDASDIENFLLLIPRDERRHGYFRALRCFYNFLYRRYAIENIFGSIEPPKRQYKEPHWLTIEQINELLTYPHSPKIMAALMFMVDTGARLGEVSNLTIDSLAETPYSYIATIKGKTGTRTVPICYETYHALMVNLPFPWTKHRLGELISYSFKHAGIRGTAHTLRHSFGTLWEGDEIILQRIMGHRNLETTKIYRHLRINIMCQQHREFTPLNKVLLNTQRML